MCQKAVWEVKKLKSGEIAANTVNSSKNRGSGPAKIVKKALLGDKKIKDIGNSCDCCTSR